MITDLVQIRRLGDKKREENLRFRAHLKTHRYPERKFERMAQEIQDSIDCTQCAQCCREGEAGVNERDITRISRFVGVSHDEFLREYTVRNEDGERVLKRIETGCVFLQGNLCSIYEVRPSSCAGYPHLVRGDGPISTRMWQFVDRASYCPIVYNSLEAFKAEVHFRSR